jgi:hypothetical protein
VYADINGLRMFYETGGTAGPGKGRAPVNVPGPHRRQLGHRLAGWLAGVPPQYPRCAWAGGAGWWAV